MSAAACCRSRRLWAHPSMRSKAPWKAPPRPPARRAAGRCSCRLRRAPLPHSPSAYPCIGSVSCADTEAMHKLWCACRMWSSASRGAWACCRDVKLWIVTMVSMRRFSLPLIVQWAVIVLVSLCPLLPAFARNAGLGGWQACKLMRSAKHSERLQPCHLCRWSRPQNRQSRSWTWVWIWM